MADIAGVIKSEILRLARKAVREQTQPLKKSSITARRQIAQLRSKIDALERQIALLKKPPKSGPLVEVDPEATPKLRFQARGLKSHRQRLGLSAGEFGKLAGVTAQTVYNWEAGTAPRPAHLPAIAALRAMGKREVRQKLEEEAPSA